ncbi:MAG: 6-phosphogluconolactonase [Planctomycetota bacterium]
MQVQEQSSSRPFVLALAGGSTPKRLYQLLAELPEGTINWSKVVLLWGDERNVPSDSEQSNFRMVRENLLDHVEIPADNILAVPDPGGEAKTAAAEYDALLRAKIVDEYGSVNLDCALLGMGDDVHTASLFPGTTALAETEKLVVENWVEKLDCWRITLTAPTLNAASSVLFLIAGNAKQQALHLLWHGERDAQRYPSQLIQPASGELRFMLDEAAVGENRPPDGATLEFHS